MAEQNNTDRHKESTENLSASTEKDSENFNLLIKRGFEALMPTIRVSNSLPKDQIWDLFCTSPSFKPIMDSLGSKALELMAMILQHQGIYRDIRKRDLEEKGELIVEANDKILERVSTHLDELSGIRRNPSLSGFEIVVSPVNVASGSWNKDINKSAAWKEDNVAKRFETPVVLRNARVTQRPQVKFLDKIDNSSTPFTPRINEKPNSLKPLAILLEVLPNKEESGYSHPYEFELDRFQDKIDTMDLTPRQPQHSKPIEETELLMITQEVQLLDMLQELRTQTEIAVDLEHHSYRSFQGFTCLMQISTREKDYIIDTLELRHKLHVLNEVFTHPKIVKVFHGADSDIQWLQRDLSLYVVNMFDTYQAALLLSLPRLSLAYLLKSICNVNANKHFQLYDWRTRPLAQEAIKYAREDTHYLLYIYDVLWNSLIEKSKVGTQLLQTVLFRSADTCKKRYWKFILKDDSHEHMYRQSKKNFDNRQMYALKELYTWRDRTAREEDESTGYILPNHMLLLIAEKLPKEMQGILACCNPIPPLVRQNLVLLHQIILKAREQPLVARIAPGLNSEARVRPTPQTNINLEGPLHCPHDLTHNVDFRNDLPTLLDNTYTDVDSNIDLLRNRPALSVFGEDNQELDDCNVSKMNLPNQIHFMSPFDRYKKMLLYAETEEGKDEERREEELARDTQNLLDECLKERLKAAEAGSSNSTAVLGEILAIKEEKQKCKHQSRKQNRSQDTSNSDSLEDNNLSDVSTIKEEFTPNALNQSRKRNRSQDSSNCDSLEGNLNDVSIIKEETTPNPPKRKRDYVYEAFKAEVLNSTPLEVKNEKDTAGNEWTPERIRQRQRNASDAAGGMAFNARANNRYADKNRSGNFSQYDYSQVDYNQYQHSDIVQTPKNAQNKFKPKGKKKQQNKSFTFARQYQRGGQKKF